VNKQCSHYEGTGFINLLAASLLNIISKKHWRTISCIAFKQYFMSPHFPPNT